MALKKTQTLDLSASLGVSGTIDRDVISRLDRLEIDTRPGEQKLVLKASTYASTQAIDAKTPIAGGDEQIIFGKDPVPAVEAILDPETNAVLEPAVPAIPSIAQLMNSPVRVSHTITTVGDLYNGLRKELYKRWPELRTRWAGSEEV